METITQPQIREWKIGEKLENLTVGDVAKFRDMGMHNITDVNFKGLYDGKDGRRYIIYSRDMRGGVIIIKWGLDDNGLIDMDRGSYLFNGERSMSEFIESGEEYKNLDDALSAKGL